MSAEQDAGKSGKKLFSVIALALFVALGGGYIVLSWLMQDSSGSRSAVNLHSAASGGGASVTETPRYRELLKADNDRGATRAARNNQTFIASLPQGLDSPETPPPPPPPPEVAPPSPPAGDRPTDKAAGEKRQERLQKALNRIRSQHSSPGIPAMATAMWSGGPGTGMSPAKGISGTDKAVPASDPAGKAPGIQLIPALTRIPAYIETEVDSDNTTSQVVASIPTGRWAGAQLHSPGVKLAGNGVEIHFTRMSWNGMDLRVNAYALSEKNLTSSVATTVNNRWFSRIVLPAALGGLGGTSTLYKNANTQVIQGNYGSLTGRVGMPDGDAVAGVILGGMAEKGADVLARDAAALPAKQVTVSQLEVVSILFVDAVMSDDTVTPRSPVAASGDRPATLAEAGQQTQTRLQAAIERRQAEMRRRYGD